VNGAMVSTRIFILTEKLKKRLIAMGFDLRCHHCEEELETGQRIVSRRNYYGTKHYHEYCYGGIFI